jgi:large subunit ribosomal protein L1
MAKKADLLEKAKELKLEVNEKNTIAQIEEAIANAENHEVREAKVAKAGKRSEKSLKEAEEKVVKEERKASGDKSPQNPEAENRVKKGPKPITRPKLERRGKKYQEVAKKIEQDKIYELKEALKLVTETNPAKFDASVEIHVRLGVDPRQADQNIRSTVSLPHGTGKLVRVAVFAPSEQHDSAKKAGADVVGEDDFLKQLDKGVLDFDVLIATPQFMPKLSKYARILGPRGLMPNPKSGTVSGDVVKATNEAKAGKVEYRVDKQAIVHLGVGKVSFGSEKLHENTKVFFDSLATNKPASLKGTYIKSINISSTMGPGIKVEHGGLQ